MPKWIAYAERWMEHYTNRSAYEWAMLADSGGTVGDKTGPEKDGGYPSKTVLSSLLISKPFPFIGLVGSTDSTLTHIATDPRLNEVLNADQSQVPIAARQAVG